MKRLTAKTLKNKHVPGVLISGLILASAMGWTGYKKISTKNFYENEVVFPKSAVVESVTDGDTFTLKNGLEVRLIGVDTPERGKENFEEAKDKLDILATGKKVYFEYDRTQDDQFGRIMAWVWVDCEAVPSMKPWDYMRIGYNKSRPGMTENPEGCKKGKLIQEEMVKAGLAKILNYKGRGELKYEERMRGIK